MQLARFSFLYLSLYVLFFTLLFSSTGGTTILNTQTRLCSSTLHVPHNSIQSFFQPSVPVLLTVRLRYKCYRSNLTPAISFAPVVIIAQGALLRPRDYHVVSNRLALSDFLVVIPDYTLRNVTDLRGSPSFVDSFIETSRAAGFDCPIFGQFGSVSVLQNVLSFLSTSAPPMLYQKYDLKKTLILAHSFGGTIVTSMQNGECNLLKDNPAPLSNSMQPDPLLALRLVCEGFTGNEISIPEVKIRGFVFFEGVTAMTKLRLNDDQFFIQLYSSFDSTSTEQFLKGKTFNKRAAIILIADCNHYGINDFVDENINQRPVCSLERPEPENTFTTTKKRQKQVLTTISKIITAAYKVHMDGKEIRSLQQMRDDKLLLIEKIEIL